MEFFTNELFKLGSFSVTGWMLVAAIAVVVLLIVIIAVAASASKKKKKKAASKKAAQDSTNTAVAQSNEVAEEKSAPVVEEKAPVQVKEEPKTSSEPPLVKAVNRDEPKVEEVKVEEVEEVKPAPAPIVRAVKRDDEVAIARTEPSGKKVSPRKQGLVEINVNKTVKETKKQTKKTEVTKVAKPTAKPVASDNDKKVASNIIVISGDPQDTFGKYYIIPSNSTVRPYKFCLKANNGQIMFESEPYKAKPKLASINAFKKHCANGMFEIDEDKTGSFRYKLYSKDGTLIGVGESYSTKNACENSIESVKKFADSATVIEDTTVAAE